MKAVCSLEELLGLMVWEALLGLMVWAADN